MLRRNILMHVVVLLVLFAGAPLTVASEGTVVEFTRDAAWCWFQDERAVVDTVREKLVIGSTNNGAGIDIVIYDLKNRKVESKKSFAKLEYTDDHNAPGLCIAPDGNYIAIWAHHYDKHNSHFSMHNGTQWSAEAKFDWNTIPGGTNYTIAYSNVCYLSKEKRMFNLARANERAPNFLFSDDYGKSWKYGGQLTTNKSSTYNKGYYKYWSNGVDRIDIVFTEQHPRDTLTSIYHGYISGGKSYSTTGELADADIYEQENIPEFGAFTKVFANGTDYKGMKMVRCWQADLMRYADSSIAIIFQARADSNMMDHRNFYARYDGTSWKTTYIGKAGGPLYLSEQDYTGLGALCPDDPDRIYISSPYDPGNDSSTPKKREIWRGTTSDKGTTWVWEAVTSNSSSNNYRPIVPQWKKGKEALLWFSGQYDSAQHFTTNIVGIISEYTVKSSSSGKSRHVKDAKVTLVYDPFTAGLARLKCSLQKPSPVTVQLFSASGKLIKEINYGIVASGDGELSLDVSSLAAGMYSGKVLLGEESSVVLFYKRE